MKMRLDFDENETRCFDENAKNGINENAARLFIA
jgi:hypothetical protein